MKAFDGFPKGLPIVFTATVAVYLLAFYGIEHSRDRKGPWSVQFDLGADGAPMVVVSQEELGIDGVRIVFPEEAAPEGFAPSRVAFSRPRHVPFVTPLGECFFQDLTFLPGTVTLRPFDGHEIEMLPRALFVNRREYAWEAVDEIRIYQTNRVPHLVAEEN